MKLVDRYVAAAVFRSFVIIIAVLTTLFSLLTFVEQLASVGQGHYRLIDAVLYMLLTVPARLLQVTPVCLLLGTLLALGTLARHGELVAMQSLGVSEHRIFAAVLKLAAVIVIGLALLAQFIIPPAQQRAQARLSYALSAAATARGDAGFWAQGDRQFLNVRDFAYGNLPEAIDIYAFLPDGVLGSYIHADRAEIQPDGSWRLIDVVRKTVVASQFQTEHLAALPWASFMSAGQLRLLMLPPADMPPVSLYRYVRFLAQRHQQSLRYEQELWSKISLPLSIAAMIMIAAPFVFGQSRAQSTGRQITIGAIIGMVFYLGQQLTARLGLLLDLNPALTALAPPLLLMALAGLLFRRLRR